MAKFFIMIIMLGVLQVDCNAASLYGIPPSSFSLQSLNAVDESSQSIMRIARHTLGHKSQVQTRDQTVIVVPNSGSNGGYRGVPTAYGSNRGETVVVVPKDNNYGR